MFMSAFQEQDTNATILPAVTLPAITEDEEEHEEEDEESEEATETEPLRRSSPADIPLMNSVDHFKSNSHSK